MKLIAENSHEDQLLPGLVSLLRDLRVDACGFRREEAFAPIFWSSEDFSLELPSIKEISEEERTAILANLESDLVEAMILAGFDVIQTYLKDSHGVVSSQRHRIMQ